jgi:hypothetical protein
MFKEESDKEVKNSSNQRKHADSELSHQPEVELVEHRDVTQQNGTCWQFNNVLKGVNHCNHHAKLDHSKCSIC